MISIVVPVYNTQAYLPRCLDSILNQSLADFEVLMVEDGSRDESPAICDDYARRDGRFRAFHIENAGVSNARNVALDHARGEYIAFVDSDDWIEPDMLKRLSALVDGSGMDAAMCDAFNVDGERKSKAGLCDLLPAENRGGEIDRVFLGRSGTLWNKLIGKKCIGETRFRRELGYGEDICFLRDITPEISCLRITPEPLYNYRRMREGNVVASRLNKKYGDLIVTMEMAVDALLALGYDFEAVSRIRLCAGRVLKASAYAPLKESAQYRRRCKALLRKGAGKASCLLRGKTLSLPVRWVRYLEYRVCLASPVLVVAAYKLLFRLKGR